MDVGLQQTELNEIEVLKYVAPLDMELKPFLSILPYGTSRLLTSAEVLILMPRASQKLKWNELSLATQAFPF